MTPSKRERLDKLVLLRGLARSREQAHALILSGAVEVNGIPAGKPGRLVAVEASLRLAAPPPPFVSRGGIKLDAALEHFRVQATGRVVLDVGASTGGFTDVLLQRGAVRVYAVDVGYGQLDLKIRNDPRVVVLERCNVRHLKPESLPEAPDLAVVVVSFISLRLVLPAVKRLLSPPREMVALVKPQFEVGRGEVGKGGVVRDAGLRERIVREIAALGEQWGMAVSPPFSSPILGPKGNREYFLLFRETGEAPTTHPGNAS
jgi:23S rRNA (cytidine1920-2'-O)/16S rRNA (cytidine1409-2'-O)-methyltransferase